jgi:hypothetical protein
MTYEFQIESKVYASSWLVAFAWFRVPGHRRVYVACLFGQVWSWGGKKCSS